MPLSFLSLAVPDTSPFLFQLSVIRILNELNIWHMRHLQNYLEHGSFRFVK